MKKLLTLISFLLVSLIGYSQVMGFRTTAYAQKEKVYGYWSSWSDWEDSDMLLTIDLNTDVVTIYSPRTQIYSIYNVEDPYYDSDGDYNLVLKFIDQDYDRGTMRLLQRVSGASEVYIEFANVMWVYRVRGL